MLKPISNLTTHYTNPGFYLTSLNDACDLVYPGQNPEVLSNMIGYLGDWIPENTDKSLKIKTERIGVLRGKKHPRKYEFLRAEETILCNHS